MQAPVAVGNRKAKMRTGERAPKDWPRPARMRHTAAPTMRA